MKNKVKLYKPYKRFDGNRWEWWIKAEFGGKLKYYIGRTKTEVVTKASDGVKAYYFEAEPIGE